MKTCLSFSYLKLKHLETYGNWNKPDILKTNIIYHSWLRAKSFFPECLKVFVARLESSNYPKPGRRRKHFDKSRRITSHHVTSRHVAARHVTSRHVASRRITLRRVTSHHVTSRHVAWRHVASHIFLRRNFLWKSFRAKRLIIKKIYFFTSLSSFNTLFKPTIWRLTPLQCFQRHQRSDKY
jgi:hypothetical protein